MLSLKAAESASEIIKLYQGVVVSLSGGGDSTALLHLLWQWRQTEKNFSLRALHVAYGLRDQESADDLRFCQKLCADLGVPLSVYEVSPAERGQRVFGAGGGIQDWARCLRQKALAPLIADGWCVATGHHADDLAETVLLRLARGAGPGALLGMRSWAPPYWRPLLTASKQDILEYLRANDLSWRNDSSNTESKYHRNIVRHRILPELEAMYPGVAQRLIALAEDSRDLAEWTAARMAAESGGSSVDADSLAALPRGVARAALAMMGSGARGPTASPPPSWTRRTLDAGLTLAKSPRQETQMDLAGGIVLVKNPDGHLRVNARCIGREGAKKIRFHQYKQTIESGATWSGLLEPGSHCFLRRGTRQLLLEFDTAVKDGNLKPIIATLKPTRSSHLLKEDAKVGRARMIRCKDLLHAWGIPASERVGFYQVNCDANTVGVFDPRRGETRRPFLPGGPAVHPAEKTHSSHFGLNLRYLNNEIGTRIGS